MRECRGGVVIRILGRKKLGKMGRGGGHQKREKKSEKRYNILQRERLEGNGGQKRGRIVRDPGEVRLGEQRNCTGRSEGLQLVCNGPLKRGGGGGEGGEKQKGGGPLF